MKQASMDSKITRLQALLGGENVWQAPTINGTSALPTIKDENTHGMADPDDDDDEEVTSQRMDPLKGVISSHDIEPVSVIAGGELK